MPEEHLNEAAGPAEATDVQDRAALSHRTSCVSVLGSCRHRHHAGVRILSVSMPVGSRLYRLLSSLGLDLRKRADSGVVESFVSYGEVSEILMAGSQ